MRHIPYNRVTGITASSENGNFPASSLLDGKPKRKWQAQGAITNATLTVDIAGAFSDIAIFGTNAKSATITFADPNEIHWDDGDDFDDGDMFDNAPIQYVSAAVTQSGQNALWMEAKSGYRAIAIWSNYFENANWQKVGAITIDTTTGETPTWLNGIVVRKITFPGSAARIYQEHITDAGEIYVYSIRMKYVAGAYPWVAFVAYNGSNNYKCWVNLATGYISANSGGTGVLNFATATLADDGYYDIALSGSLVQAVTNINFMPVQAELYLTGIPGEIKVCRAMMIKSSVPLPYVETFSADITAPIPGAATITIDFPCEVQINLQSPGSEPLYAGVLTANVAETYGNANFRYGIGRGNIDKSDYAENSNGSDYYKKRDLPKTFSTSARMLTSEFEKLMGYYEEFGAVPSAWILYNSADLPKIIYAKAIPSGTYDYLSHVNATIQFTEVL